MTAALLTGQSLQDAARDVVELQYRSRPELTDRYGPDGQAKCVDDTRYTLLYLAQALNCDSQRLFTDYVGWAKVLFLNLKIDLSDLAENLAAMATVLEKRLPPPDGARAAAMINSALANLDRLPDRSRSEIDETAPAGPLARGYLDALLRGDKRAAGDAILSAVAHGMPVRQIYLDVFQPVLREVGRLWQTNRLTVAHEHFITAATQAVMSQLYPYVFTGATKTRRLVAACTSGELHEIGLRMVTDCFEMEGWDTYYLGSNSPPQAVVAAVQEQDAEILAVSATLGAHVGRVAELVTLARRARGESLKILVGGYPFNTDPGLWQRIGADGCAPDAVAAVAVAARLDTPKGPLP